MKSEGTDENSNHSDLSSVSGDAGCQQAVAAAAATAIKQVEASQWMFPQFESVGLVPHKTCPQWDEEQSMEERMDETDGPLTVKGQGESSKSSEVVSLPPPPPVGVNKRKRSNPQRVYDSSHLDRTKVKAASAVSVVSVVTESSATLNCASQDSQGSSSSPAAVMDLTGAAEEPMDEGENWDEVGDVPVVDKDQAQASQKAEGINESDSTQAQLTSQSEAVQDGSQGPSSNHSEGLEGEDSQLSAPDSNRKGQGQEESGSNTGEDKSVLMDSKEEN